MLLVMLNSLWKLAFGDGTLRAACGHLEKAAAPSQLLTAPSLLPSTQALSTHHHFKTISMMRRECR